MRTLLWLLLLTVAAAAQQPLIPGTKVVIPIAGTVAAQTQIVAGVPGQSIYVTAIGLVPAAGAVVTFSAGTGANCATNNVLLTGALTFAAGAVFNLGSGYGAVLAAPVGASLCITIATAAAPGSLAYGIF
jgi:hypothetical protein